MEPYKSQIRVVEIDMSNAELKDQGFKWNEPIKFIPPTHVGKLKRIHFVGDAYKRYIDDAYNVFWIHFATKQIVYQCSTFPTT